jgi:hypothetical protein
MKRFEVRNCDYCGAKFEPTRHDQRFHARECHDRYFQWEKRQALAFWRQQRRQMFEVIAEPEQVDDVA